MGPTPIRRPPSGRYKDAAGALKKTVKLEQDCYVCYTGLAAAYLKLGDAKGALESCDQAIRAANAPNLKGRVLMASARSASEIGPAEAEFRMAI